MAINFPDSPSTNDTHVVGDKTWIWNGTYWHVKQGVGVTIWADADSDTKIQVEESSDEDIIRFDTAGTERMTIAANGAVNVGGTLTAGAFSGPLTGNVTGNASGTALTVTQAAQSAITSVGTLTSATITGDLIVDTSTLKVDSSNNRVGIGTASPDRLLTTSGAGTVLHHINATDSNQSYTQYTNSTTGTTLYTDGLLVGLDTDETAIVWNQEGTSLRFGSGGAERMTILSDGKVGIGEVAPASDLVVRADSAAGRGGEITILNYASSTVGNEAALNFGLENSTYAGDAGNAQIKARLNATSGAADLIFSNWTGGAFTEHLRILSDGKVGIGTTTPTHSLHIAHPGAATQGLFAGGWDDNLNSNSRLAFNDNSFGIGAGQWGSGSNEDDLVLYSYNQAGRGISFKGTSNGAATTFQSMDHWMRITEGKVGIGTTAPASKLHVYNGDIRIEGGTSGNSNKIIFKTTDNADLNKYIGTTAYWVEIGVHNNEGLRVNNSSGTNIFQISGGGNVGIGTTSPAHPLDVVGSSHTYIGILAGANSSAGLRLRNDAHDWDVNVRTTDEFAVYSHTSSATRFLIDTSGNVGIGTTSPTNLLHLAGTDPILRIDETAGDDDVKLQLMQASSETEGTELRYESGTGNSYLKSIYSAGHLYFQTAGANTRMTITNAGNVGIGTTTPSGILDLGNGTGRKFWLYHGSGAVTAGLGIDVSGAGYEWSAWCSDHASGAFMFGKHSGSAFTPLVKFDSWAGGGRIKIYGTGTTEGGELEFLGGSSFSTPFYMDRYGNDLRFVYNAVNVFQIEPTGSLNFGDAGQLKCGNGNDLLVYANGSNSFIDHNGDGDLWIRVLGAGENLYLNTAASAKILIQRNSVTQMEFREGATTHGGTDAAYGGIGFAAAGVYMDRNWGNYPGLTICNSSAASDTNQGEFRLHGANHTYASYPATGGSDFGVVTRSDGGFATGSDERRKENITTISGALATVNSLRGVEFNTIIRDGSQETLATMGGKMYGFIAQEAKDLIPNVVTYYPDEDEPLESGWCSAYSINYAPVTAVLVEAIKELTTRLETLESA